MRIRRPVLRILCKQTIAAREAANAEELLAMEGDAATAGRPLSGLTWGVAREVDGAARQRSTRSLRAHTKYSYCVQLEMLRKFLRIPPPCVPFLSVTHHIYLLAVRIYLLAVSL